MAKTRGAGKAIRRRRNPRWRMTRRRRGPEWPPRPGRPNPLTGAPPLTAMAGTVVDSSPHLLIMRTADGREVRLPMTGATSIWHGGPAEIGALKPYRRVIARLTSDGGGLVDRVWVDIARVTGRITQRGHRSAEIDAGPHREPQRVVFSAHSWEKVRVRHPRFEPGQVADIIGIRSSDGAQVLARTPATAQPAYVGTRAAIRSLRAPLPAVFDGTVTWWADPATADSRAAAYPALDPSGDGADCPETMASCAGLPFLSLGSVLHLRNECADRLATVTVTACGCAAAWFCDRCAECGASARGRLAELTPLSFVELGGELSHGCFNAALAVG